MTAVDAVPDWLSTLVSAPKNTPSVPPVTPRTPLSVAIVGINYAPESSGIAPYTTGLARGLANRGHTVQVLTGQPHYPSWERAAGYRAMRSEEAVDGVRLRRYRHYVPRRHSTSRRAVMEMTFGIQAVTGSWGRPDVVLCISPPLISTVFAATRNRLSPHRPAFGILVHDLYTRAADELGTQRGPSARASRELESLALRMADSVAVIHSGFAEDLVGRLGVPADRIREIRNWTHVSPPDSVKSKQFRMERHWHDHETVVLHAGNMGSKQGLENVIAAARVAAERRAGVRFVLLGDGHRRADLQAASRGLPNLEFLPPISEADFPSALGAADILLVNELPGVAHMAMPSKLTSYFAAGKPILAATGEDGFTAREIAASAAGLCVPAGRPDLLLDEVLRLRDDHRLVERLSQAGPRYCAEMLSPTTAIDHYEQWIYDLAATRASAPSRAGS